MKRIDQIAAGMLIGVLVCNASYSMNTDNSGTNTSGGSSSVRVPVHAMNTTQESLPLPQIDGKSSLAGFALAGLFKSPMLALVSFLGAVYVDKKERTDYAFPGIILAGGINVGVSGNLISRMQRGGRRLITMMTNNSQQDCNYGQIKSGVDCFDKNLNTTRVRNRMTGLFLGLLIVNEGFKKTNLEHLRKMRENFLEQKKER